jgi:hypothetical protein
LQKINLHIERGGLYFPTINGEDPWILEMIVQFTTRNLKQAADTLGSYPAGACNGADGNGMKMS